MCLNAPCLVKPYANTNVFFKLGLISNSTKSNEELLQDMVHFHGEPRGRTQDKFSSKYKFALRQMHWKMQATRLRKNILLSINFISNIS